MKPLKQICLFILIATIFGCSHKKDPLKGHLSSITGVDSDSLQGEYIIINFNSCISCVNTAKEYMIDKLTYDRENKTQFVLTYYSGLKELKIELGDLFSHKMIKLDSAKKLYPVLNELSYPVYLLYESGQLVSRIDLDTYNDPFVVLQ